MDRGKIPTIRGAIRRLTEQHRELVDEPLHLAVSYLPAMRDQRHIFLFEVIGGTGESINPERDLFEVVFETTPGFPMGPDEQLHLILTNPRELVIALREGWSLASEVVNALRAGDYVVLYKDEVGERVLNELQAEASRHEAALLCDAPDGIGALGALVIADPELALEIRPAAVPSPRGPSYPR